MKQKRGQLAARRKAAGFSQDQLAERLKVDRSTVARWEAGETEPQPWLRPRLARSLQLSNEQLGELLTEGGPAEPEDTQRPGHAFRSAGLGPEATPTASERSAARSLTAAGTPGTREDAADDFRGIGYDSDEELMKRRAFLINAAVLAGLSKADTQAAIEHIRQELGTSLVEERAGASVEEWQEIAADYGDSYFTATPAEFIRLLMVDMLGVQAALRRHGDDGSQRDLLRVAALLAAFTAQTISNMEQPLEAKRWWRTAKHAADRSGDPYSALWVRGREIVHALNRRPVPAVLRLIEEAEGTAGPAPREAALELLGAKAQALALAGNSRHRDTAETLRLLRERFSESPAGYSGSVLGWGQERLHHTESFTNSRLGDLPGTETATAEGLDLYAANDVARVGIRGPAGLQLNLAFALVRAGDVSEGLNHARAVIDSLPQAHRGASIEDARILLGIVPSSEQRRTNVQEYREWAGSLRPPENA